MTRSEKLRTLVAWFDVKDKNNYNLGQSDVQDFLRQLADDLEKSNEGESMARLHMLINALEHRGIEVKWNEGGFWDIKTKTT